MDIRALFPNKNEIDKKKNKTSINNNIQNKTLNNNEKKINNQSEYKTP